MKKLVIALWIISLTVVFVGCTTNKSVNMFGGETTIILPANSKLTDIEWEDTDLWYMTRPMRDDEIAETYTFAEKSSFGIHQGVITIKEVKNIEKTEANNGN